MGLRHDEAGTLCTATWLIAINLPRRVTAGDCLEKIVMETMQIVRDSSDGNGEFTLINKCDFDPKTMKEWVAKKKKSSKKKATRKAR